MMKFNKKIFVFCACALLTVATIVVLCVLLIPRGTTSLKLEVSDITVLQGESRQIEYECNNPDAQISFEIYDTEIAIVNGNSVYGVNVGTTKMRVTARYKDEHVIVSVGIKVSENPNMPIVELPEQVKLFLIDKNFDKAQEDGFNFRLAFKSNRPYKVSGENKIVKVEEDVITALKLGTTTLLFESTSTTDVCPVTVVVEAIEPKLDKIDDIEVYAQDDYTIDYSFVQSYYTGEAVVRFEPSSDIISFENNILHTKRSGVCTADVYVNDVKQMTINITVKSRFTFTILPNGSNPNCVFEDGVLKVLRGQTARFSISVSRLDGSTVNSDEWGIRSQSAVVRINMGVVSLTAEEDCEFEIYSDTLVSSVIIKVQIVESL